jgi:glycosyltransferase involved in cell wall biosynthesis
VSDRTPLVSIIVNVFNGERYLRECLDSIVALEGDISKEVIIIDDASTDGSAAVIAEFANSEVQCIMLEKNIGAAAAINRATEAVRGQFVARIDYDDRYRPDFLRASLSALEQHPEAALVCASAMTIDPDGVPGSRVGPEGHGQRPGCGDSFAELLRSNFVTAPTLLARTRYWRQAYPIPMGMDFCDWYINLVMAEAAPVVVLDRVTADYRVHPLGMHYTKVRSGMGERVTREVLDRFLGTSPRAGELAGAARAIRAGHAKDWGDKYFAAHLHRDALRCYWESLRLEPAGILGLGMMRRITGMVIGRNRYETAKALLGTAR